MDTAPLPPRFTRNLRDAWRAGEMPDDSRPIGLGLSETEMGDSAVINIDVDDAPINGEELLRNTHAGSGSSSTNLLVTDEDTWGSGIMNDTMAVGPQFPQTTYVNHGAILCEDYAVIPP